MAAMMKILIEQNKGMIEIMKIQSDKNGIPGPSNFNSNRGNGKGIEITSPLLKKMVLHC